MKTSRRTVLGGLAGWGLVVRAPLAWASDDGGDALRSVLRQSPVGERLAGGWVLVEAYPPLRGGATLVLGRPSGGEWIRVDVVRRGDPVKAPVSTPDLELFTMDGGGGVRWVEDGLLAALEVLGERLQAQVRASGLLSHLLTHDVRVARFPGFMGRAARELRPTLDGEVSEASP